MVILALSIAATNASIFFTKLLIKLFKRKETIKYKKLFYKIYIKFKIGGFIQQHFFFTFLYNDNCIS